MGMLSGDVVWMAPTEIHKILIQEKYDRTRDCACRFYLEMAVRRRSDDPLSVCHIASMARMTPGLLTVYLYRGGDRHTVKA